MVPDNQQRYAVNIHREVKKFLKTHPDLDQVWSQIENQILQSPRSGPNIDHLRGDWYCSYRWRSGPYRIKYEVHDIDAEIHFYDAGTRGDVYKGRRGTQRRRQ